MRKRYAVSVFLLLLACGGLPAAALIDESFRTLEALENICEERTVIMPGESGLILGGPGSKGEKAGIRLASPAPFAGFTLKLGNFHWSHNAPQGGHPTEILLLNSLKQGYVVALRSGELTFFRQDAPGQRTELGRCGGLWAAGTGFTVPREFTVSRTENGRWNLGFSGIDRTLAAEDNRYRNLNSVSLTYGVYIHGYSANLGSVLLCREEKTGREHGGGVAFFDPWGGSAASGPAACAAEALRKAGLRVRLISGGGERPAFDAAGCLIVPGAALADRDLEAVLDYLRSGGRLLIWGEIDWELGSPAGRRFCERILGTVRAPRSRQCSPLALTPEGEQYPGLRALDGFAPGSLALLPLDNSIEKQTLLPQVETVNLAEAVYDGRNWVQQPDRFRGTPLQLSIHRGGEFAGSRVLYAALPLKPESADFAPVMKALLECLDRPAGPYAEEGPRSAGLNRRNFFRYPGAVMGALCFANFRYLGDPVFDEDLDLAEMQVVCYCIPWLVEPRDGEIVDWERLDEIVAGVGRKGKKLMLDPYPSNFNWKAFRWVPDDAVYQPEFERKYLDAMRRIALRYKENPVLVAMWCTPHTHSADFAVYRTPENHRFWTDYLRTVKKLSLPELNRRYGLSLKSFDEVPFPEEDAQLPYNIGPLWSDYVDFHVYSYQNFLRRTIRTIRDVIPELPLTIRSAFMDPALSMAVAAEFPNVATHIECLETSINTEGFYRSYALGFGIPITGENGWPKASPAATRMALADFLLGNYAALTYSFDGIRWARASFPEFREVALVRREMAGARYPQPQLGLLLPDSTLYSSRPANFFSIEKLPSLEFTLEQMTCPFVGVSSELPRLDKIRVLLDTGTNRVFSPQLKRELAAFLRRGGVFVGFPESGKYTRDGSVGFLESLKLPAEPGEYAVGSGKVILLPGVKEQSCDSLRKLFRRLGLKSPVAIDVPVCNALFEKGDTRYLVLFDKRRELVGSFFRESTHDAETAKLPALELTVAPEFEFSEVRDAVTNAPYPVRDGRIRVKLPPARFLVLRFE